MSDEVVETDDPETSEYDLARGPDPATFAAARPEPTVGTGDTGDGTETTPVTVVGIGPGNLEYLTPVGKRAITDADVVLGFETVVDFIAERIDETTDVLTCGYRDESRALEEFGERIGHGDRGIAVLMGDPNHSGYQFVGKVQRAVERAAPGTPVRIIPGISSLQVAASRARTPMEATAFVTLHKSGPLDAELERLTETVEDRHLLVLPRPFDLMPGDVAARLLESGADPDLQTLVLEKLTHPEETIHRYSLGELAEYAGGDGPEETPFSDLSVLAVRKGEP